MTSPTPELPKSPILTSRSPMTVSKYIAAATTSVNQPMAGTPAPLVPDCVLCDPEGRSRCETCEQQWLACKLWYHSNDTSSAMHLKQPYPIPAASNASNRAMAASLGYPIGSARGLGLDLGNDPASQQIQATGSRFSGSDIQGPDEWGQRFPSHGPALRVSKRRAGRHYSIFNPTRLAQHAKVAWKSMNRFFKCPSLSTRSSRCPHNSTTSF